MPTAVAQEIADLPQVSVYFSKDLPVDTVVEAFVVLLTVLRWRRY
jgi:hypothetical protein